jgi:hypothetical protein
LKVIVLKKKKSRVQIKIGLVIHVCEYQPGTPQSAPTMDSPMPEGLLDEAIMGLNHEALSKLKSPEHSRQPVSPTSRFFPGSPNGAMEGRRGRVA